MISSSPLSVISTTSRWFRGLVRADDEPSFRVFADVLDGQRVVNSVEYVVAREGVATS
jgi:hypothetical protein